MSQHDDEDFDEPTTGERLRAKSFGDLVHPGTPGEDVFGIAVGTPAQRALEDVGVGVRQARQHRAPQPDVLVAPRGPRLDADEPADLDLEPHAAGRPSGQPR